jgi:hypothetical protein
MALAGKPYVAKEIKLLKERWKAVGEKGKARKD